MARVTIRFRKRELQFDVEQIDMMRIDGKWGPIENPHQSYSVLNADRIIYRSSVTGNLVCIHTDKAELVSVSS